jgi:hypothetical protein
MKEKDKFKTPEQLEAKKLQQAAWVKRKAEQRTRDQAAEDLYVLAQDRPNFWAHNRAKLSPEELQALEARQAEFLALWGSVQDVIDNLNKSNAKIGPPDGLPFVDVLWQEVEEYVYASGNCRIVHHADAEELSRIHHPDANPKIREEFYRWDPEWYLYGIFTRFTHAILQQFLRTVAEFITKYPNHSDIDPQIGQQILAVYRGHVPVPVVIEPRPEPTTEAERKIHERLNAGFTTPPPFDWKL